MAFHMGYVGYAKLGGTVVRIESSSLNPTQSINEPNLVQGEYNKRAWNYGAVETGGNISGPLGESTSLQLAQYSWDRIEDGDQLANSIDVEIYFYKGSGNTGRKFDDCQINTFGLSISSGDVASFTVDFMGTTVSAIGGATFQVSELPCEKLVTWDKCGIDISVAGASSLNEEIQSWSLDIKNNLQRLQRVGQPNLFPVAILAGIREVTGSLTIYASDANNALMDKLASPPYFGADSYDDYNASTPITATFTAGSSISLPLKCYFERTEVRAGTDTMTYSSNFVGLCNDNTTSIG